MRVGLFGGTFDPVHIGHLVIAEWVRSTLPLDRVIFIPAGDPPHKQEQKITAGKHRLEMLKVAIRDNPEFGLSDFELIKTGKSYTYETLLYFKEGKYRHDSLFLIIGSDSLLDMPNWFNPEGIVTLAQVIVYPRPGYDWFNASQFYRQHSRLIDSPSIQISSTDIRNRIQSGNSVRYLVPEKVEHYILDHQLYKR